MSETAKRDNGKKIVIAVAALVVAAVFFGVVYVRFSPVAAVGAKEITIEVIDDKADSISYMVHTDAGFLRQAMKDAEGLTVEGTESDYGLMVDTVNGVTADYNVDGAYWAFYVDGVYCNYGVDEQPVEDGQTYQIVYTTDKQGNP